MMNFSLPHLLKCLIVHHTVPKGGTTDEEIDLFVRASAW